MTLPDHRPTPPLAAEVAVLIARHLRLLSRVDRLSATLRADRSLAAVLAELDAMAAEARA